MSNYQEEIEKHLQDEDAIGFARKVLDSLRLEREKRSEACDNSSHTSSIEGFAIASPQVAQVLKFV